MPRTPHRFRSLGAALAAASALLVTAAPAHAAGAAPVACPAQTLEHPFPGDSASYFLVPGGHFEDGLAPNWSPSGGADTATDDEYAGGRFLSLPAGGAATSKEVCVGLNYPTLRFNASAASGARLTVQALFRTPDGVNRQLKIADLTPGGTWQPTRPVYIVANLLALFPNWDGRVAFRFTASGGTVNVDDVYVDPYER
jgi:hypothetical protein